MNYYDRILELISEQAKRVRTGENSSIVTPGRHGIPSGYGQSGGRLVNASRKKVARFGEILKQHTAGPEGRLPTATQQTKK